MLPLFGILDLAMPSVLAACFAIGGLLILSSASVRVSK